MLNKLLKIFFAIICLVGIVYLALPNFPFPDALPGSIQSQEPADLETPLRRGYFTNLNRSEVLSWYGSQFNHSSFLGIKLPTILLNYPPENAQTIIRDQTGSTYLQEYVHPFREGVYINGFETPTNAQKPLFFVDGKTWNEKIIIRYVPSHVVLREVIFIITMTFVVVIFNAFKKVFSKNE